MKWEKWLEGKLCTLIWKNIFKREEWNNTLKSVFYKDIFLVVILLKGFSPTKLYINTYGWLLFIPTIFRPPFIIKFILFLSLQTTK